MFFLSRVCRAYFPARRIGRPPRTHWASCALWGGPQGQAGRLGFFQTPESLFLSWKDQECNITSIALELFHPTERSDKTRTGEAHEIYQLECRLLRQCLKSHPSSHSISVSRDFPGLVLGSYPQFWGCVPFLGPICVFPTLYSSPKIPDL